MHQAISYTRVSTSRQGHSGLGLQAQQIQIDAFAQERAYRIVRKFSDVHTGMGEDSIANRDDLQEAIALARKKRWPIIIADYDRLGRDELTVRELLDDPDLVIISASHGENADRAVIEAAARKAQATGKEISNRTKEKLRALKKAGKRLGNPRYEHAMKKAAEARSSNAHKRRLEIVPVVKDLRMSGMRTAGEIAQGLNARGYRTARGGMWKAENIRRTLKEIDALTTTLESEREQEAYRDNPDWGIF